MSYYRKVIHIRAEDSPNVRLGLAYQSVGQAPTGEVLLPGILPWDDYVKRRSTWDEVRQCIGLDGMFYLGAQLLLFPPKWLDHSENLYRILQAKTLSYQRLTRKAIAIGIDPAEGGDRTTMAAVDRLGLLELTSEKTPNTATLVSKSLAFIRKWQVEPSRVRIDRGGGGKSLADHLRDSHNIKVETVAFGSPLTPDPRKGMVSLNQRKEDKEERYACTNKRAEMFWNLRMFIDPEPADELDSRNQPPHSTSSMYGIVGQHGFAIRPGEHPEDPYTRLRNQLAVFPLLYDREGRIRLPSKNRNRQSKASLQGEKTLVELIGYSPDEADALALAIDGLVHSTYRPVIGVF